MRTPVVQALVLAASVIWTGCSIDLDAEGYTAREERSFKVAGKAELNLATFDGAIDVRAWDRPEVQVVIERRAVSQKDTEALPVDVEQTGDRISIDARKPGAEPGLHLGWHMSKSVRLVASVPRETNLVARSADGAITVQRVTGRIEVRTADGAINVSEVAGPIEAHTSDGAVKLTDVNGDVEADSGDGSINVAGHLGSVRVRTSDGMVTIRAAGGSESAGDWDISTGDGSVEVELPSQFDAVIDVHTGDGVIHTNNLDITTSGELSKETLRGTIGNGGRSLRIRTGDGSIRLRRGSA